MLQRHLTCFEPEVVDTVNLQAEQLLVHMVEDLEDAHKDLEATGRICVQLLPWIWPAATQAAPSCLAAASSAQLAASRAAGLHVSAAAAVSRPLGHSTSTHARCSLQWLLLMRLQQPPVAATMRWREMHHQQMHHHDAHDE